MLAPNVGAKVVLPLLARTATNNADAVNELGRSLMIFINATVVTSGASIVFKVRYWDGLTATYTDILTSAAITGVGLTILRITPDLVASANLIVQDIVPLNYNILATHADTKSVTYSVIVHSCA